MVASMRGLGFENLTSVTSLSEALSVLATTSIDWLITSFFVHEKTNALQLLKLARQEPDLKQLKVSLFAADNEADLLPKAFSLGLFSCHKKPFNKDTFTSEMRGVLERLEANSWHPSLASAEYLRTVLSTRGEGAAPARFRLEQALNQAFPEEVGQLLHLAESCFLVGNAPAARSLLWQAVQRQPGIEERVAALIQRHGQDDDAWKGVKLGRCVVVDSDTAVRESVKEALLSRGAKTVQAFEDGKAAWTWLKVNKEPDLLVMEWRIPGVSGPLLLQRCRSQGFHQLPVIVQSSLVKPEDEPLLKEMGVAEVLRKPFRKESFLNCVAASIGQSQRPSDLHSLELKIRALLASGRVADATNYMQLYLAKGEAENEATKALLTAEFAFAAGDYKTARDIAVKSMHHGNKSVALLNLLGKTLMRLREFSAALQIFQKANDIVPNSVARLCAVAETQQELGDAKGARKTLDQVDRVDDENQDVINSKVNIGLATGDKGLVQGAIDRFRPTDNVLAYINNKAIAHVKAGEYDQAIQLYTKVIDTIPHDKPRLLAIVGYNLALAQARKNDVKGVVEALARVPRGDDELLGRKVDSLAARAKAALGGGKPLQLSQESDTPATVTPVSRDAAALLRKLKATSAKIPSDLACCYGLFPDEGWDSELVKALLSELPPFKSARRPSKSRDG
jgi:CheY-like chemotaxis protein/TolA-binding protein